MFRIFFKISQIKKKKKIFRESEREKEGTSTTFEVIFFLIHFFFFQIHSNALLWWRLLRPSYGVGSHIEKKGWKFLHARKPPKLCLFCLSLSFKKNSSKHILNFIENFIYMLSQFCVVNLWWEAKRFSSNLIQILWRGSQIYNYSLKLTLFLKEGKRSGKRLKNGKKRDEKGKIFFMVWL